ncbi:MAG: hypothetical protein ABIN89_10265, partial [Chitinophagaceae bacterium]
MLQAILANEQKSSQAQSQLENLRQLLFELSKSKPVDGKVWLTGVAAIVGSLSRLLNLGVLPSDATRDIRHAMAMIWSAAVLTDRVLTWYDDPKRAIHD